MPIIVIVLYFVLGYIMQCRKGWIIGSVWLILCSYDYYDHWYLRISKVHSNISANALNMCTDISINSYCWVVSGGQEAIPYTNTEVNT